MKIKHLFVLPLVALLASCGNEGAKAYPVDQKLPEDLQVVESEDDAYAYVEDKIVTSIFNFNEEDAAYHLAIDANISYSQSPMAVKGAVKGDVYFAYEGLEGGIHDAYLFVQGLDLNLKVTVPTENNKTRTLSFVGKGVDFTLYYVESLVDDTYVTTDAYLDLSDEGLQDLVYSVLNTMGYIESREMFDQMLLFLFGADNPGYLHIDVSDVLYSVNKKLKADWDAEQELLPPEEREEYPGTLGYFADAPFSTAFGLLKYYLSQWLAGQFQEIKGTILQIIPMIGATIAVNPENYRKEGFSSASLLLNGSAKGIAEKLGASKEDLKYIPDVRFGLLVSVGNETGADSFALQELKLGLDIKNMEVDEGVKVSVQAQLSLECSYNDEVLLPFPENFDAYTANIDAMLVELLYSYLAD